MTDHATDHSRWYADARPIYERLGRTVEAILEQLLKARGIEHLAVTSRAKSVDTFADKVTRKRYSEPRVEVTDLCGVRVVTYLESDVARVVELLRDVFEIDEANTVDKTAELPIDRVGYRSVHVVCALGAARTAHPEYSEFAGLVFEVQVRTVLQHAWAQIEHDRSYKFGGVLPPLLKRRLHLAAGQLESVDREFDAIAREIDAYGAQIAKRAELGDLNIPLNTPSLRLFASHQGRRLKRTSFELAMSQAQHENLLKELDAFGIVTLADLAQLFTNEFFTAREKYPDRDGTNEVGLARDAMMYADIDKYFAKSFSNQWSGLDEATRDMLASKYGAERVDALLEQHAVDLLDSYDEWEELLAEPDT